MRRTLTKMAAAPRKIGLIGPVFPYRGGIAQHTTMLGRTLRGMCDLTWISYSRQYPSWLFPGESDRDEALEDHREPDVRYDLDSLRPRTWARAVNALAKDGVRVLILPWWTVFWAPCYLVLVRLAKSRGMEIVFLCHNTLDHEASGWKTMLTRRVLRRGSRFVTHTRADAIRLRELLGDVDVVTHPHPVNRDLPEARGRLERRAATELLFFGFIRPYKGLETLLDALPLMGGSDIFLSVVGEWWDDIEPLRDRLRAHGVEDRVEFVSRYVSDVEVADYFARADLVVLPYRSATGSGVVPVAYRYHTPVVVTAVGGLPDVVRDGETGFLVPADDPAAIARAIGAFRADETTDWAGNIDWLMDTMTWERFAEVVLDGEGVSPAV